MLEKMAVGVFFVLIMTILCGTFYSGYVIRKQTHELILKCMEQDTTINCAVAFKTGEKT